MNGTSFFVHKWEFYINEKMKKRTRNKEKNKKEQIKPLCTYEPVKVDRVTAQRVRLCILRMAPSEQLHYVEKEVGKFSGFF